MVRDVKVRLRRVSVGLCVVAAGVSGCGSAGQRSGGQAVRQSTAPAHVASRSERVRHRHLRPVRVPAPAARTRAERIAVRAAAQACGQGSLRARRARVVALARHASAGGEEGPPARLLALLERARGREVARLLATAYALTRPAAQRNVALAACAHVLSSGRGGL